MPLPPTPYPACWVEFEGQAVFSSDVRSLELETNVGYLADQLTLVLDNARLLSDFIRKEQPVEVWLGYVKDPHLWDKSELVHLFSGAVDGVLPGFGQDRALTIKARDHTRLLIDSQADPGWSYASLGDAGIVTLLAKQAGLKSQVSASLAPISEQEQQSFLGGGYPGDPMVGMSGWDIIQTLAVRNGFVAYVTPDKVLYWGPRGAGLAGVPLVGGILAAAAGPNVGTWTYLEEPYDLLAADFDDSALIVNKVTVARWVGIDDSNPEGFVSDYRIDSGRLAAARGRVVEKTVVSATAGSVQDCGNEAEALLKAITTPAITAVATVEGSPLLAGDVKLTLAGKALGRFKGDYWLEATTHRFSPSGYDCQVRLSSVRPEASEVYRSALNVGGLSPDQAAALAPDQPQQPVPVAVGSCAATMVDNRSGLPTIGSYGSRAPERISGVTLHYTAGPTSGTVEDIAAYQTSPAAAHQTGAGSPFPGIAYTILVTGDGKWHLCHDLTVESWHSAAIVNGVSRNLDHVGICYTGDVEPNDAQINGLACAILWVQSQLGRKMSIEGHRDPGYSTSCPGPRWPGWKPKVEAAMAALSQAPAATSYPHAGNTRTAGSYGRAPSVTQVAIRAGGWPASEWDNAAAIVNAESGNDPGVVNSIGATGLFQIYVAVWHADVARWLGLPEGTSSAVITERLKDPATNSKMAHNIWLQVGHWGYPGGWATAAGLGLR